SNPPPELLIVLPFGVNIFLKIYSAIRSPTARRQAITELNTLNGSAILSADQVDVLDRAIGRSSMYVTTNVTMVASILAALLIVLRNSQPWLWWAWFGVVIVAIGMWTWVSTRNRLSSPGCFNFSIGTWIVIAFCAFDAVLGFVSVLVTLHAAA